MSSREPRKFSVFLENTVAWAVSCSRGSCIGVKASGFLSLALSQSILVAIGCTRVISTKPAIEPVDKVTDGALLLHMLNWSNVSVTTSKTISGAAAGILVSAVLVLEVASIL